MGENPNLAIGRSTLIHTGRSNQHPRFTRSGIYWGDLCDRAIYAIGRFMRSGDLCDRAIYAIGRF
ncbi:hypothetical protein, partial [Microcoleus sp. S13_B4]|uniref:hypothetical protein n=1 Tax=Microcoleus sp. S13_B4 TaxID=3055408 RepID=UPI002FD2A0CA